MFSPLRASIVATAMLAAPPAHAGETLRPAPWTAIKATLDTVGTCATDEFSGIRSCYLVRCDPHAGLVFAIREPTLGHERVRRVRLIVGGRRQTFALHGASPSERWARMADTPTLLPMLTSGATWANLETTEAGTAFGTGFDLSGAKQAIGALAARCRM